MTASQMVTYLMKRERRNQTELAALIGAKGQSNVSEALKRDLKASVFLKMVNALGYDVYLVSKRTAGRKPNGFLLDGNFEEPRGTEK